MDKFKGYKRYHLFLVFAGLFINFIGVKIALGFKMTVFLDSIGTILASAYGGFIIGIMVGFFSNVINGINDPITLYYSIISIMISVFTVLMVKKGVFNKLRYLILAILGLAFIGGALGSLLTWLLYGFNFGSGISAPYAIWIYNNTSISKFWSQFIADMGIDLIDKSIAVIITYFVLKYVPYKYVCNFPLGYLWSGEEIQVIKKEKEYRSHSLKFEIITIIVVTGFCLGVSSMIISFVSYKNKTMSQYESLCDSVDNLVINVVKDKDLDYYLESNTKDIDYYNMNNKLNVILNSFPDIKYMYIYKITEEGAHVIFDVDTTDLKGEELGTFIPFEEDFIEYKDDFLTGNEIDPVVSNGTYGWLLTVYRPIYNSSGECIAYVATDVDMSEVLTDRYVFAIRLASLLFGITIVIVLFTVWVADKKIIYPINQIAKSAKKFAYESENERMKSILKINEIGIDTGNEIENLYKSINKTMVDVTKYITTIAKMQKSVIITFANLVESRDKNTGKHVKNTASYVNIIANKLKEKGYQNVDDIYINKVTFSAPLHDIGKIEIPDAILNKPGKLTTEEFDIIKTHTTAGRRILLEFIDNIEDGEFLDEGVNMVYYHHERFDGNGYPCGLKGEDIPLSARIMAVADVLDALISKRSYKEAYSIDKAKEIIISESGTHFDPVVVNAFVESIDEIILIDNKKELE